VGYGTDRRLSDVVSGREVCFAAALLIFSITPAAFAWQDRFYTGKKLRGKWFGVRMDKNF